MTIRLSTIPAAIALAGLLALASEGSHTASAHDARVGALTIAHAWSRPGFPNRPAAAYMAISNTGSSADRLLSAASPAFEMIELHTVEMADGVMAMKMVEAIAVPGGETVDLAPGGFHLMLFGARTPFREGERFPVTLTFETAGTVEVRVRVRKRGGDAGGHGDHAGHGTSN